MMRLLKTPEEILAESYSYISVLTIFIGVMFAYNLCAGLLRAIGNSLMPLLFLIFSSIGNVLLDLLFITQFDMGIRGAAIATVVAQGISVLLCIFYILRYAAVLVPEQRHFAAIVTFISQNAGAGNKERIKKGMRIACRMSICWGIIATVILALFAKDLVALFGSKQAEILANAALYLRVASPFYAVLGILYNMRNGLQAMGEKRKPLTSSFMELVGKIVFSARIIPVLGYWGVIICEPLIWCGMTAQLVYCYVHVMRDNLQNVGMET